MEQHDLLNNDLSISGISQANLVIAAKWGKFLAVMGLIFCGLMVFGGIAATAVMSNLRSSNYGFPFMQYMGIFYIIFAIILFMPCLYLLKFSNKIQDAVRTSNQESLDVAFSNLKSLFKFYGVFTIVMLALYALLIEAAAGGMFMH